MISQHFEESNISLCYRLWPCYLQQQSSIHEGHSLAVCHVDLVHITERFYVLSSSYGQAVAAAFIEIKTPRFCKKVQVDPYLEVDTECQPSLSSFAVIFKVLTSQDTLCSLCSMKQGPYFCRLPLFSAWNNQDRLDSRFSFEVVDIFSTQGPLLLQLLLPRMLGAAACGEDAAQALDA